MSNQATQSFKLPVHIERLLEQRYYQDGETWTDLVNRVTIYICGDTKDKKFIDQVRSDLLKRVWLPNSPCLVNAGTQNGGLFACFVARDPGDSLETHFDTLQEIAHVAKRGGGCGFTTTPIRPQGSPVAGSAHGYAYGPLGFAEMVSFACHKMTTQGFRKMALMHTLRCDHPDIEAFIDHKQTDNEEFCFNFNQSIMATDRWLTQAFESPGSKESRLLDKVCQNMWNNGEPGLLFYDRINAIGEPYASSGQMIEATNPCGEQPLPPNGSCNLGSININNDVFWNDDGTFNYSRFEKASRTITRFLDLVGSKNNFPTIDYEKWYNENRPIGVGIMGYADALLRQELKYGSPAAERFMLQIMGTLFNTCKAESQTLGQQHGIPKNCKLAGLNQRNITLVSIAPTGSISFLADCSSGIEPIFSPKFTRIDERGETYHFRHDLADEPYFKSAINPNPGKVVGTKEHIMTQAICQKWVDSGVSKTINLPSSATVTDIKNAVELAWRQDCKGITVYRNSSRNFQVLNDDKENENNDDQSAGLDDVQVSTAKTYSDVSQETCPGCEKVGSLVKEQGCTNCKNCGYSACSI